MNAPTTSKRVLPILALAIAVGLAVVAVTLAVVLDGDNTWAEVAAAAGIVAMVIALGVLLGTAQGWANGTRMSMAAVSTIVIGMGAVALVLVTYMGGTGDSTSVEAVSDSGVSEEGASLLSQQTNNEVQPPGYAHDVGDHPTLAGFQSMDNPTVLANVPGGTLLPDEVDVLRDQLNAANQFAVDHNTVDKAMEAGFYNTTNDVPFMGAHFLNREYLTDGVFDAGKPEGLLFSKLGNPNGEWQLVGVWYLLIPGLNPNISDKMPPEGFAGKLDLWHTHFGLCTRAGIISENNTAEGCAADKGNFIGDLRWMMHAWVYPDQMDNPDGVFIYLNKYLWEQQNVSGDPNAPAGLGTGAQ